MDKPFSPDKSSLFNNPDISISLNIIRKTMQSFKDNLNGYVFCFVKRTKLAMYV